MAVGRLPPPLLDYQIPLPGGAQHRVITISSPGANFKLQLHPQEVILMLCQAGSSRMGSCIVGAMHLICQKAGRDSEQYSTGFHAGKSDP